MTAGGIITQIVFATATSVLMYAAFRPYTEKLALRILLLTPRQPADHAALQPCGLNFRSVEAGNLASFSLGRIGRRSNSPPQFGQRPPSRVSAHVLQKVHSNEQITASIDSGGRSLSQHSQLGLS
jgi:hypothetical protein